MHYNKLGEAGLEIPPIIFGTRAIGNLNEVLDDKI